MEYENNTEKAEIRQHQARNGGIEDSYSRPE